MFLRKTISWMVSPHAKQRAWERYGVVFSPQKWFDFCRTIQKEKYSFRLAKDSSGNGRYACYFQQQWFLVGCNTNGRNGVITTFLPIDSLTDADKTILRSHHLFCRTDEELWDVRVQMLSASTRKRRLESVQISTEELPKDFDQISLLLEKAMR